jgi:hypothetical protein
MTTTLLRRGTVYTPTDPFATAMLVADDRVAWVGSEGAAASHADGVDRVVDLAGALVTPAFVDAHVHTTETGLALDGVDLAGTRSLAEALDRLAAHARARPGTALAGSGWDEGTWPEGRPPTAAELDRATRGAVVYLSRVDVHTAVVSPALVAARPDLRALPGWEGDGLVRRQAHDAARRFSRDTIGSSRRRGLQLAALRRAASVGIGCVTELAAPHINSAEDVQSLRALAAEEALPDLLVYWGAEGGVDELPGLGALGAAGDLCVDGTVGSRTAALSAPYLDRPGERGYLYLDQERAVDHVVACTQSGVQAGFHVIGDDAVRVGVEAVARAADRCGLDAVLACRHRLEHVEMLADDLVPELVRLGVVASVQPAFDALWGGEEGMYARRLGPDRARVMNPFAAMSRAGVQLAFGSDSPVTPLDPWGSVRAAAFHRTPGSGLSARGAFSAHTRGGWRAARVDDAGVLAPGALASYAVWDVHGELVVQAADERVANWSTDPRSGVPGLPDLTPGAALPTCLRTVASGRTVFAA